VPVIVWTRALIVVAGTLALGIACNKDVTRSWIELVILCLVQSAAPLSGISQQGASRVQYTILPEQICSQPGYSEIHGPVRAWNEKITLPRFRESPGKCCIELLRVDFCRSCVPRTVGYRRGVPVEFPGLH